MNFISKFINEKVLKEGMKNKENDKLVFNKDKEAKTMDLKEKKTKKENKFVTSNYARELAWYLENDTNLDRSLLKMTENTKENSKSSEKKQIIKIKKESSYKSLKWILFEFITGVVLIFFTMNYVQSQPAEKKFLDSSIQLWINTFQKIVWSFWWVFKTDMNKIYLEKKQKLLDKMINYEKEVLTCLDKQDNEEKQKYLKNIYMKVKFFEQQLASVPLNQFIQYYEQYSSYVYSLGQVINKECNKNN